jgi:hypothetical protein
MTTATFPKSHSELAFASSGNANGHVPGHCFRDVDVSISTRSGRFRVHVCENWGSCQGHDEEHGRRETITRGDTIAATIADARSSATRAGITTELLEQALNLAGDAAEEVMEDANENPK